MKVRLPFFYTSCIVDNVFLTFTIKIFSFAKAADLFCGSRKHSGNLSDLCFLFDIDYQVLVHVKMSHF